MVSWATITYQFTIYFTKFWSFIVILIPFFNYYPGEEDLKNLDPSWVRKRISIVSQEPTLFACSIKDNISYGKNASIEEVNLLEYAAFQAKMFDTIY